MLSSAAAEVNLMKVVVELGQAQAMGTYADPLENVPEVAPVLRAKVRIYLSTYFYMRVTKLITLHRSPKRLKSKSQKMAPF